MKKVSIDKKKLIWYIIAAVLLIAEIAMSVSAMAQVLILNMLPNKYIIAIIAVLAVIAILNGLLLIIPIRNKHPKRGMIRRGVGVLFTIVMIVATSMITFYLYKLNSTVTNITGETGNSNVIAVYVLKDDKAKKIKDAKDYNFGVTEQFDYDNTRIAIEAAKKEAGKQLKTTKYDTVTDMVDALYREEIDALILNEAYASIIVDQKKYESFDKRTKIIFEFEIVEEEETEVETELEEEGTISKKPFIVYVSGSDTRAYSLQTSRSDVNIIAVINPVSKQILLVNTPRDYYIPISQANFLSNDKLTHCGIYGYDCSMDSIGNLYGQKVSYYAQINFTGFSSLVNAMGGITVDNDRAFTSDDGYYYPVGVNNLGGAQALSFVRERHAFLDGDIQRGKNQMKALKSIINKARSSDAVLKNYTGLMESLEGLFATNLTADEISELVKMQLNDNAEWNILTFSVSGTGAKRTTYTVPNQYAYVMIPDTTSVNQAKLLIQKVMNGNELKDEDVEPNSN